MFSRICGLLLLLSLLIGTSANGQVDSVGSHLIPIIQKYQEQDSFEMFVKTIKQYKRLNKSKHDLHLKMIKLFDQFPIYKELKTENEITLGRSYYMSKVYSERILYGRNASLPSALLAHDLAKSQDSLGRDAWYIEMQIGHIYAILKDYDNAIYYYTLCLRSDAAKSPSIRTRIYNSLADAYGWNQEFEKERELNEKAFELAKEEGNINAQCSAAERLRNNALRDKEYESYNDLYAISEKLINENKIDPAIKMRVAMLYESKASYHMELKNYSEALGFYEKAKKEWLEVENQGFIKRKTAKVCNYIANCYIKMNKFNASRNELLSAFEFLNEPTDIIHLSEYEIQNPLENTLTQLFETLSKYYEEQFEITRSVDFLDSSFVSIQTAIEQVKNINENIFFSSSKELTTEEIRDVVNRGIKVNQLILKASKTEKNITNARYLFDYSKNLINSSKYSLDQYIRYAPYKIQIEVSNLKNAYRNDLKIENYDYDSLFIKNQQILNQISSLVGAPKSDTLLKPIQTPFIEYLLSDNEIFYIHNLFGDLEFGSIFGKEKLDSLIELFDQEIIDHKSKSNFDKIAGELSALLLPFHEDLPPSFTIIPDGKLALIPFESLIRNNKYLIYNHTISYEDQYMVEHTPPELKEASAVYLLAPVYEALKNKNSPFSPLLNSKGEIESIANNSMLSSINNNNKSISEIEDNLLKADIFHFTGHAYSEAGSIFLALVEDSSLLQWNVGEIFLKDFNLEMTTLSACKTGFGLLKRGDGIYSLARNFRAAGSKSIIYSLWDAQDISTAQIMGSFYKYLYNEKSKDYSLRKAKLDFLENCSPEFKHPFYWANFVASGNMHPIFKKRVNNYYYSFLILIPIIGYFFLRNNINNENNLLN